MIPFVTNDIYEHGKFSERLLAWFCRELDSVVARVLVGGIKVVDPEE